jgi:LysM repeat protein
MSRLLAPALLIAVSASLAAGPPAPAPGGCGGSHIVVRGDTLYSIARRCRSSVVAIAQASRLADPRRIEIGQRLVIPGPGAPAAAAERGREEPAAVAGLGYRFAAGDTLYSLARWARVGVGALIAANPGLNPHKIEIGDAVRLPAGAVAPDAARQRERGLAAPPPRPRADRPGPAPAPPPRVHPDHPAGPPRGKPDDEDEREPEGM